MLLGKYEVLDQIGIGGFGRVLLARDPEQPDPAQQLVAIKRLRRARAQRKGSLEAIINEARIGSYLSHPNIVRVIELAQVGRDLLLIMEFVNGIGLDELLSLRRQQGLGLPPEVAIDIAVQAGGGLHYAHTARSPEGTPLLIRHRDIKPSNIMICRRGLVRVMDFGVALAALPRVQTTTGTIKGTLRYLSPEQAQGTREIGPETDQFALALVLTEMLIGHPVYDAEQDHQILLKALRGQVGTAIEEAERVLSGIGPILTRALAISPSSRYPDTGAFVEALKGLNAPPGEGLAHWVHLGLEERARLAAEEPQGFRGMDTSNLSAEPEAESHGPESFNASDTFPLGWANEQLSAADESGDAGFGGEDGGWELEPGQDLSAPILARTPRDAEGWAMLPAEPDGVDWEMLKRSPPSDEWFPAQNRRGEPRVLKKTDLSAELDLLNEPRGGKEANAAVQGPAGAARATDRREKQREGLEPGRSGDTFLGPPRPMVVERARDGARSGEKSRGSGAEKGAERSREPIARARSSDRVRVRDSAARSSSSERARAEQARAEQARAEQAKVSGLPFATPEEQGAPSPTAYVVKRPGRDRVGGRRTVVAGRAGAGASATSPGERAPASATTPGERAPASPSAGVMGPPAGAPLASAAGEGVPVGTHVGGDSGGVEVLHAGQRSTAGSTGGGPAPAASSSAAADGAMRSSAQDDVTSDFPALGALPASPEPGPPEVSKAREAAGSPASKPEAAFHAASTSTAPDSAGEARAPAQPPSRDGALANSAVVAPGEPQKPLEPSIIPLTPSEARAFTSQKPVEQADLERKGLRSLFRWLVKPK